MNVSVPPPGVAAGRLNRETLAANFADAHPPLGPHEARVAADRCYFCHDAPCVAACPTEIDIPLFIRQIQTGQPAAAGRTILDQNILGGMCARVCPTETLCEGACVRQAAEGEPVRIGALQRCATDAVMALGPQPYARASATGRRVAVIGAGPAGLACAHRLAMRGHDVTVFEGRAKIGGLNEYGIAAYKTPDGFAQAEAAWVLGIDGVTVETGRTLGDGLELAELRESHDAAFLGIGLAGVNALRAEGEELPAVRSAVEFIAELRQSDDLSLLPIGRRVVVIGGGMTAIDAAVQSRLLGAEEVTLVYRRSRDRMGASRKEQDRAASLGVMIRCEARPVRVVAGSGGCVVEFARTVDGPDGLADAGETFSLPADSVFKAIGQSFLPGAPLEVALERGRIAVDAEGRTSVAGIWAGGDCVARGEDLTVTAVAQGRDAAESIHRALSGA